MIDVELCLLYVVSLEYWGEHVWSTILGVVGIFDGCTQAADVHKSIHATSIFEGIDIEGKNTKYYRFQYRFRRLLPRDDSGRVCWVSDQPTSPGHTPFIFCLADLIGASVSTPVSSNELLCRSLPHNFNDTDQTLEEDFFQKSHGWNCTRIHPTLWCQLYRYTNEALR